jgi:hypothetical protein
MRTATKILLSFFCTAAVVLSGAAVAQDKPAPQLSPEQVKTLKDQEKALQTLLADSNKKKLPTFTVQQCRSDTQEWTYKEPTGGVIVVVNGQSRMMPPGTPHTPIPKLLDRIYEMTVCETVDSEFEKQFHTYTQMRELYERERESRYTQFLLKHGLFDQFISEDAKENE